MTGEWKLVPCEPTEAMIESYFRTCERHGFRAHIDASCAWETFLSASPPAPAAEVEPVGFNINETVLVRLNDHGREIIKKDDAKWGELYPRLRGHSTLPEEDADGWSKWQLWRLMKTFGPHMLAGAPNPFDITIRIPLPPTTDAIRAQARREGVLRNLGTQMSNALFMLAHADVITDDHRQTMKALIAEWDASLAGKGEVEG